MFDLKKKIKLSDKDILDILYLMMLVICTSELFLHSTYVIQEDKWIGDILFGSHKIWDALIYSLSITISLIRFSVQSGVTKKQRILAWIIFFVFSFHYLATGMHIYVLAFGCLYIGAYNISFSRIIKVYFWENLLLSAIVVMAALFGIIQNRVYGERASLGFTHPNTMGAHIMAVIMAYFVWRQAKITWMEIVVAEIIEWIIFRLGVSRSSFIAVEMFLCLCVCYKLYLYVKDVTIWKKIYEAFKMLMCFSVFIFGGIIVLLSYFYSESHAWMVKLNQWFSTRLSLGRIGFDKYNASLLGKPVKMIAEPKEGEIYFYLDSFYVRSIFDWGILMLLLFLMLYFMVSYRAKCLDEFLILSALSVFALHGVMEVYMSSLVYNPYILFLMASTGQEITQRINGGTE